MTSTGRTIARFAARFDPAELEARQIRLCGRAFVDTFAVAVAGLVEEPVRRALRYARAQAPQGPSRLWGTPWTSTLEGAALFNGIAAHALDYDDASSPMSGHPSVALLPALVALGEARGSSGRSLASAYVVGFEVACRLGRGLSQGHYDRGWHLTSTLGTLASAIACGKLLELDEERLRNALGFALAQAAGTRASFGTDAKPFQAGHAAASGLRAALLAEQGLTAAGDELDGKTGFTTLYSDGESLVQAFAGTGTEPLEIDASGIEVKKYPACYAVHRPLDGLFDIRGEHALSPDDVMAVRIRTSYGALAPLIAHEPRTGAEARFSMQYAIAAALVDGEISLRSFTDDAIAREPVRALMPKVTAHESTGPMTPRWATVDIDTRDGCTLATRVETLRGAPQRPLTNDQLLAKVSDCLRWGNSDLNARDLMDRALSLESRDVPSLLAA